MMSSGHQARSRSIGHQLQNTVIDSPIVQLITNHPTQHHVCGRRSSSKEATNSVGLKGRKKTSLQNVINTKLTASYQTSKPKALVDQKTTPTSIPYMFKQFQNTNDIKKIKEFEHASGFRTSSLLEKYQQEQDQFKQQFSKATNGAGVFEASKGNSNFPVGPIVSIARDAKEHILLKQFLAQEELPLQTYKNILAQQRHFTPSHAHMNHSQLQQQQLGGLDRFDLERKIQNLTDMPTTTIHVQNVSHEVTRNHQSTLSSRRKKQSIDMLTGNRPLNNQVLAHNQRRLKQFRPIQIIAAQTSTSIPLCVQKLQIKDQQSNKVKRVSKQNLQINGNVPIVVPLSPTGTPTSPKQLSRQASAVSKLKRGKTSRSKTVGIPHSRLQVSRKASTNTQGHRKMSDVANNHLRRNTGDPFANEKIAMTFKVNTSMMQTVPSPQHNQQQQYNQQTKQYSTSTTIENPDPLTQKRLDGLMQLLERDLGGKPRSLQNQINIVDEFRRNKTTVSGKPFVTTAEGGGGGGRNKVLHSQNTNQSTQKGGKMTGGTTTQLYTFQSEQYSVAEYSVDEDADGRDTDIQSQLSKNDEDETTPLSMHLFETFRDKLFYFPFQNDLDQTEEAIMEVVDRPQNSQSILFSFLTLVHQMLQHATYRQHLEKQGCHCHPKNTTTENFKRNSGYQASSSQTPRLTHQTAGRQSSMLITENVTKPLSRSMSSQNFTPKEKTSDKFVSLKVNDPDSNSNQQQNQTTEEILMQNRDSAAQMLIGGVSYSQNMEQRQSLPSAINHQQLTSVNSSTMHQQQRQQNMDYSGRELVGRQDSKLKSGTRAIKGSNFIVKKDYRNSKKGSITAGIMKDQVKSVRSNISIENIPQINAAGRNKNILSNSLQMLSGSDSIDSHDKKLGNVVPGGKVADKSYHLRYVSQGMQRSSSIESPGHPLDRNIQKNFGKSKKVTNSREQILTLPNKSIVERSTATQQQYMSGTNEKRTIQQTSQNNSRRVGGVSQSNLVSQPGIANTESMLQHSLNLQSNHSSIVVDAPKTSQLIQNGVTMKNTASEYGPIS